VITTVTATTAGAVTTSGFATAAAAIAIATLLALLIYREVVVTGGSGNAPARSRVLNVAIVPLVLAFLLIAGVRLAEALR
jgi:hypothetical protein